MFCLLQPLSAQRPTHTRYVEYWDKSEDFAYLYGRWDKGKTLSKLRADDEEFFISRVRPRVRFVDADTQVDKNLKTDRKFMWWVPCGVPDWNAIPSYYFNSEVFSTWSYIDHWGNWTAPFLRMPAAFADVAHKNGVSVTATATISETEYVTDSSVSGKKMNALVLGGAEKYIKYLQYYGLDGGGYNSEFSTSSVFIGKFTDFLANSSVEAKKKGLHFYSNDWYSLTTGNGTTSGGWDDLSWRDLPVFDKDGKVVTNHFFLNYNWGQSQLTLSKNTAEGVNRSPFDVYAGINMQKGSGVNWSLLKANDVSIGVWGAHSANMLYENRGGGGSSPISQQREYQKASERLFTGGKGTPLTHYPIGSVIPSGSQAASQFFGISEMLPARSTLQGDLANEPFVSYLNLGNGQFFNIKGVRAFANEWYNLGMQDFLPTWRWWFSKSFMGRGADQVPLKSMEANFIWSDAWFGGSCLEITGASSAEQYLQVFKTSYDLQEGDKITIRYKIVKGTGGLALTAGVKGEAGEYNAPIRKADEEIKLGEWIEQVIEVKTSGRTGLKASGKTLSMLGLKFLNTSEDFVLRLGEVALTRGAYETPQQPTIVKVVNGDNNYRGYDFKIIYKMAEPKADGTITYNDEVKTWFFKIYAQQENEEPQFCTATTSWAAYVVGAKFNFDGSRKVRYGVSAVSLDGKTESAIAWSDYQGLEAAKIVEAIKVDRAVINPNDEVTVSFEDPAHSEALKWQFKQGDEIIKEQTGGKSFTAQLTKVGAYDLVCKTEKGKLLKSAYVSVYPKSAGATPKIVTLKANNQDQALEVKPEELVEMSYTSLPSNGSVSRALFVNNYSFKIAKLYEKLGIRVGNNKGQEGATGEGGLTLSFWLRPTKTVFGEGDDGVRLIDLSYPHEGWPSSEWGYCYLNYGSGYPMGGGKRPSYRGFCWTKMSSDYKDITDARGRFIDTKAYTFEANTWTHLTLTLAYDCSLKLYINGRLFDSQEGSTMRANLFNKQMELNISRYAKFGSALDGYIDEVRLYNRVLEADEVPETMLHLDNPSTVTDLKAYFDFEDEAVNGVFTSRIGQDVTARACKLSWISEGNVKWVNLPKVDFGAGVGFVEGESVPIETKAYWYTSGAKAYAPPYNHTMKPTEGVLNLAWDKEGVYPVTLTLENAWGRSQKTFNVINVTSNPSGVEGIQPLDLSVYPNPFVEELRLHFVKSGLYTLDLFDLSGKLIAHKQLQADSSTLHSLHINAPKGMYVLRVSRSGKLIASYKLSKR